MGHPGYKRDPESLRDNACEHPSRRPIWIGFAFLCLCLLRVMRGPGCYSSWPFRWDFLPRFGKNSSLAPFYAYSEGSGEFSKPQDFDIVALVPFHRREPTEILDCYLRKNLASNHGLVDQVIFLPQTDDTLSLEWLASIVKQNPSYTAAQDYTGLQPGHLRKDTMYIWIDGDTVFLEAHTISTIVKTKLEHHNIPLVSANVVSEAVLEALHNHPGIALPYLPELSPVQSSSETDAHDWHASKLPVWKGPGDFAVTADFSPPFTNHRWLLSDDYNYNRTPIGMSMYATNGPSMHHWTISAQQHYSFLHHLERNHLNHYKFPMWSVTSTNISSNFLCFWGNIATDQSSSQSDGMTFLNILEADSGPQNSIIDGKGLAVHWSSTQALEGLDSTDLLARYRSFAGDTVCNGT
ncbi:uncharacterized protein BO97DRAFT_469633 [Aspergillus homomorphus CBS 101889]|uniref:Uncharacterized protein n=1 Tax=Aspergillus homomorphus (strain CBS 101889) TaxID=1450537 RepID=A0A395I5L5_ASPHC|nr:hypothetical protein BO97DRAFT_469633 [Aspergillus homomorphus CBS 101889]RAL13634.1 hypothetical protein BO97DRAFT_469633 [Aspergillus homomorphus CBS 101889]